MSMTPSITASSAFLPLAPGAVIGKFVCLRLLSEGGQAYLYMVCPQSVSALQRLLLRAQLRVFGPSQALVERYQLGVIKIPRAKFQAHLYDERGYLSLPSMEHKHLGQLYTSRFRPTGPALAKADLDFVELPDASGQLQRYPYITLVYEPGGSLRDLLKARKYRPFKPAQVVHIALQLAEVLRFLHTTPKIVYNDLAPDNIILHEALSPLRKTEPMMVLIDLAAADSLTNPRHHHVYGRSHYMPPERLRTPPATMSEQVDIYGLGMLMYELLAGKLEFQNTADLLNPDRQLKPISEINPLVSRDLSYLVMQAIDRDATRRTINLPTMDTLQRALRNLPEAKISGKLRGPLQRRFWLQAGLALCTIVIIFGLITQALRGFAQADSPLPTAPALPTITGIPATATLSTPTATATPQPSPAPTSTRIPTATAQP
jgi:serine/threonine protein kinase